MRLAVFSAAITLAFGAVSIFAMEIDGSTVESYERSARAMVETLPQQDRQVFAKGLMNMIVTGYPPASGLEGFALLSLMPAAVEAAHITMDGVSLEEIMERGRSLSESAPQPSPQIKRDDPSDDRLACISQAVKISDVKVEEGTYTPNLTITVFNGLDWALSAVQFEFDVKTPGRSVPWLKDNVALSISGGIEPSETRTVSYDLYSLPGEAIRPLEAKVTLIDVADQEQRQFIGTRKVIGWPDQITTSECRQGGEATAQ